MKAVGSVDGEGDTMADWILDAIVDIYCNGAVTMAHQNCGELIYPQNKLNMQKCLSLLL